MSLGRRATLLVVGCVARTAFAAAPCGFRDYFERSVKKDDNGIHKWLHYFAAYEREFGEWCAKGAGPIRMMEMGIQSGGSCKMWLNCFGANLDLLVGVDINPDVKQWESFGPKIKVEIASQADPELWQRLRRTYGGFDVILDDGSHQSAHMLASFKHGFDLVKPGGVYVIEDITQENTAAVVGRFRKEAITVNNEPPSRHIVHGSTALLTHFTHCTGL